MSASPSRRRLLQATLLAPVVASCTSGTKIDDSHTDPDARIRQLAVARELALIGQYRAAAASSELAAKIAGLAEQHEQHLAALGAASPAPSPSGATTLALPTIGRLAAAEHAAAVAHAGDALHASSSLAALLASLAASEASHAVLLT